MYAPSRGGVRGGRDQFSWENVKTDKDRECYLGHSVMAPVGKWQDGRDLTWYAKSNTDDKLNTEFLEAKELEEKALMAALGYTAKIKPDEKKKGTNASKIKFKTKYYKNYFSKNYSKNQIDKLLKNLLNVYTIDKIEYALK